MDYLSRNPALLVDSIKRPRQSVKILPVETVELMLRTAQANVPEVLPFLCVSLFTGARPEETSKLLWSDFNLPDKKLIIRPEISKTNRHRPIDLSDNAVAWLETFKRQSNRRVMAGWTRATRLAVGKIAKRVLKLLRHTHNFDSRSWGYVEAKARELCPQTDKLAKDQTGCQGFA